MRLSDSVGVDERVIIGFAGAHASAQTYSQLLGFAKTLLESVNLSKVHRRSRKGEDEMVRVWHTKMLVRIARGDLESKYRRVELLYQALENYFKLRGLWYSRAKAAPPWLARHDPETHAAFERAFEAHASVEYLRARSAHSPRAVTA
jgi:hypothetical protein